jgi:asparagine synthase (glutamine-hydrolysing)
MDAADTDDPVAQAQYADIHTYLPGDILTKVDRASMANSLEVRAPILDHEFVEWSAKLPSGWKLRGSETKHIFKKSLEPYVPASLLYRPKQGFAVPLAAWLRGSLRETTKAALSSTHLRDSGLFDTRFIGRVLDQHLSGVRDHSSKRSFERSTTGTRQPESARSMACCRRGIA